MAIRTGIVLGAGGFVGQAYEIGVLAALEWDLGWDVRHSDVIVGTSAGALTATLLRLGVRPLQMASWALGRPYEREAILEEFGRLRADLPVVDARVLLRPWRVPGRETWSRAVTRPWSLRALPALTAMLPVGRTSLLDLVHEHLSELRGRMWPDGLRICATRQRDGRRVTFGTPESGRPPLAEAVAASCAVPACFAPVELDGVDYVDGGVHSPTNADVLLADDLDLVVIVSPMSGAAGPLRTFSRRRLGAEGQMLRRRGADVVRFEPARRTATTMGLNLMASDRTRDVLPAAFFEAGATASDPPIREHLRSIMKRNTALGAAA